MRPNISLGDTLAGLHGAFGAVMALLHRQRHMGHVPGQVGPRLQAAARLAVSAGCTRGGPAAWAMPPAPAWGACR